MWKVKRMNTARIVVLTIAIGAGGIAAYLASGSDKPAAAVETVTQMQTVDVLVAKSDIGLGQTVKPDDMQWQTWPAATASNIFIRRNERPDATTQIAGSIARARQTGTMSLALRSIADASVVENRIDDQGLKRGENVNIIRYGINSPQMMQK
jgi:Flp pilus assembly protein CpaB